MPSGYCLAHLDLAPRQHRQAALDARRGSSSARGYGGRWKRLRVAILNRDPFCLIATHCNGTAPSVEVDHIVAKRDGGTDDEGNLQGACKPCHSAKTHREGRLAPSVEFDTPVVVVCGPPGSGKSTYIADRRRWGEVVVDYDHILAALSGLPAHERPASVRPFADAARAAVLNVVRTAEVPRVWIVATAATRALRDAYRQRFDATVVVLETDATACAARVASDGTRGPAEAKALREAVDRWWRAYERDERDEIVNHVQR